MKRSKYVLAFLLVLTMAIGCLGMLPASAADGDIPGVTELSVLNAVPAGLATAVGNALEAAGYAGEYAAIRKLTVSGQMSSVDFTFIWNNMRSSLVMLDISGVSYVGSVDGALGNCTRLEWVKLPALTDVSDRFFLGCTALTTVGDIEGVIDLRAQNPVVGARAFYQCSRLEKVLLPESAALGTLAFSDCLALKTVGVRADTVDGVIDLTSPRLTFGDGVFSGCRVLEWVKLYDGAGIPSQMFFGCNKLKTLGDTEGVVDLRGVTSFGSLCFRSCSEITTVLLPDNAYIAVSMFESCNKLDTIGNTPGVIDLRNVQRYFGDTSFYGATSIKWVKLPDNASLSDAMFYGCSNLTTIGGVEGIVDLRSCERNTFGSSVFVACWSIEWVKFPQDAVLTYHMFQNCTGLKSAGELKGVFDLRDVAKFGSSATFGGCRSIEKLLLRDGAILDSSLFSNCINLKTAGEVDGVLDLRNIGELADRAFYQCQSVETVLLPAGAVLPDVLFSGCSALKTIGNTAGVVDLRGQSPDFGGSVFESCHLIEKVLLPDNAELGSAMFIHNNALRTVGNVDGVIDLRNVKSFGNGVFNSCDVIEHVLLADGAELSRNLFAECSLLKTVGNTEGVIDLRGAKLEQLSFNYCTAMEKVILSDDAVLPQNVFSNCKRLDEINLTDSQQFNYAFLSGCGFDFTDTSGYPERFAERLDYYASGQLPVAYFSLSVDYDTQVVDNGWEFIQPTPMLRTKHGLEFGELVANKADYNLWLNQNITRPSITTRITKDGGTVPTVDTNASGVYVINYSTSTTYAMDRRLLTFTVTVGDEETSSWLKVGVSTPNIVETLAAYLNITSESYGYEGETLTAYLMVDGAEMYPTAVVNGSGRMYLEQAPVAGTYDLVVKTADGFEAGLCEITVTVYDPASLWEPKLRRDDDGGLLIEFSEIISARDGKFDNEVTMDGKVVKCSQPSSKMLKIAVQYDSVVPGTIITATGVKYPYMFPSYSFTFKVTME